MGQDRPLGRRGGSAPHRRRGHRAVEGEAGEILRRAARGRGRRLATTLAGEVSLANDDFSDNNFLRPPAPIQEDRAKRFVTTRDHARLVGRIG